MADQVKSNVVHPFTPPSLDIPGYVPNTIPILNILAIYFGLVLVVLVGTVALFSKNRNGDKLGIVDRLLMAWFAICGFTHILLEGTYVILGSSVVWRDDIFSQIWKEFGKADSRYMIRHEALISVEAITAFLEGPACFLIMWMTYRRSPGRYALEMLVSTGQLYGTILYFLEAYLMGFSHMPYGHPVYFWIYFVGFNFPWIVIPTSVIIRDYTNFSASQSLRDNSAKSMQVTKKKK